MKTSLAYGMLTAWLATNLMSMLTSWLDRLIVPGLESCMPNRLLLFWYRCEMCPKLFLNFVLHCMEGSIAIEYRCMPNRSASQH
jgi:hypothetical protein